MKEKGNFLERIFDTRLTSGKFYSFIAAVFILSLFYFNYQNNSLINNKVLQYIEVAEAKAEAERAKAEAERAKAEAKAEEERAKAEEEERLRKFYLEYKDMILVEGGTFTMGCTSEQGGDCASDESPTSQVTVSSFYIGKYEVTKKLYQEVMGTNPSNRKGDNLPKVYVTWYEAIEFCNRLSEKEGLTPVYTISGSNVSVNWNANGYRLPTEAEWEYAARGGNKSKGYKYSGSNSVGDVAWYSSNSDSKTHPVGTKQSNELGIYDMSGNVWEWCWDWRGSYTSASKTNPRGPASGSDRVNRGGSWNSFAGYLRTANRYDGLLPSVGGDNLGFRVVRTAR